MICLNLSEPESESSSPLIAVCRSSIRFNANFKSFLDRMASASEISWNHKNAGHSRIGIRSVRLTQTNILKIDDWVFFKIFLFVKGKKDILVVHENVKLGECEKNNLFWSPVWCGIILFFTTYLKGHSSIL